MITRPQLVKRRRNGRRLKAALSIGLGLLAGTFVACAKRLPTKPDAAEPQKPEPLAKTPADAGAPEAAATAVSDASDTALAPPKAQPADAAIEVYEEKRPDAAFDHKEHRKGMPVPDNLLE